MRIFSSIILFAFAMAFCSCTGRNTSSSLSQRQEDVAHRAAYFWKTTFDLSESEKSFLSDHKIGRLYLRLFDVVVEENWADNSPEVVPVATTRFVSSVPEGLEIVPTVYITIDALRQYSSYEDALAELITKRVLNMCSYHDLGDIREVQFDCDWTSGTKGAYNSLCEKARQILHDRGILLSGTIRLHQIEEAVYPFDRGVLMLYNTGALMDSGTTNSILSFDDVNKYLGVERRIDRFLEARRKNCANVDLAFPIFSWSVVFNKDRSFRGLMKKTDFNDTDKIIWQGKGLFIVEDNCWVGDNWLWKDMTIRVEHSDLGEILRVKELAQRTVGAAAQANILYHIDSRTISNYSRDDIEKILR